MDDSQYVTSQKYEGLKTIIEQQDLLLRKQQEVLEKQAKYISMVSKILGEDISLPTSPKE